MTNSKLAPSDQISPLQYAIITGAGSGIGRATALRFSEAFDRLILVGRTEGKLKITATEAQCPCEVLVCDLSQSEQVANLTQKVMGLLSQGSRSAELRALVNNAGVFDRTDFLDSSDENWTYHFENNLMSAVRLTRGLFPLLKAAKGHVTNVSSTLGLRPVAQTAAYSAMKAAMINWTQTLALEWAPYQIRINCVAPGLIETPMHQHLLSQPEVRAQMDKAQPLGRMGAPQEIAEAIYFLSSQASSWTTGSVLSVDGGIHL